MSPPRATWTRFLFAVRDLKLGEPSAKLVLYALASRADDEGYAYPSVNRIARDTGLSRRTVQRRLDELAAAGLIERHVRRRVDNPRHHDTTIYRLLVSPRRPSGHGDTGGGVTMTSKVGSGCHPNRPTTHQENGGVAMTSEDDNPPADSEDTAHRRRIAAMAGELAARLQGDKC